jgi:hypothetical protein
MLTQKHIEYEGFILERTGGFLSGDGCRIIETPDWVPPNLRKKMREYHAQDSVVKQRLKKFIKDASKKQIA